MADTPANVGEYTVSEISAALKRTVEDTYSYVRVRGEISGFRGPHTSGHCYFTLKDDKARLEAVVWRLTLPKLRFRPQEGIEVVATGRLTTFPGQSKYQLVIDALEPAGVGALMALLEARRKALAAEGLFAEARKKALPYLPAVIGVVSSPTGAVIRDIIHRLTDRCSTRVILWPVRVQGETSAAEVAAAIAGFNELPADSAIPRPDVLIVARGGGSLEDLWGFNEEIVVRAAAASAIPLISAVGHETDFTLIDMAADRRAPTPSAAAEIAVPVRSELIAAVDGLGGRVAAGIVRHIEALRREVRATARGLPRAEDLLSLPRRTFDEFSNRTGLALLANAQVHRSRFERAAGRLSIAGLARLIEQMRTRLTHLGERTGLGLLANAQVHRSRFERAAGGLSVAGLMRLTEQMRVRLAHLGDREQHLVTRQIERLATRITQLSRLLDVVSYRSILARGFALVSTDGEPVRSAAAVPRGKVLDIEFQDGHVAALSNGPATAPRRKRRSDDSGSQGSLL